MMISFQIKIWKLICANDAQFARVVEQADTTDLKSVAARRTGSSPVMGMIVASRATQWMDLTHPVLLLREGSRLGFCMRTTAKEGSTLYLKALTAKLIAYFLQKNNEPCHLGIQLSWLKRLPCKQKTVGSNPTFSIKPG